MIDRGIFFLGFTHFVADLVVSDSRCVQKHGGRKPAAQTVDEHVGIAEIHIARLHIQGAHQSKHRQAHEQDGRCHGLDLRHNINAIQIGNGEEGDNDKGKRQLAHGGEHGVQIVAHAEYGRTSCDPAEKGSDCNKSAELHAAAAGNHAIVAAGGHNRAEKENLGKAAEQTHHNGKAVCKPRRVTGDCQGAADDRNNTRADNLTGRDPDKLG